MQMEISPQHNEVATTKDEVDEIESSLLNMEFMFPSNSKQCIYTVPEHMKKGKEDFYEPLVISIGPVFYNKDPKLKAMQELKCIYLKSFRDHSTNASQSLKHCIRYVRDCEREIRECYEEQINLQSNEFIEMIVLDAVFLICYFQTICYEGTIIDRPIIIGHKLRLLMQWLARDLVLEENQLPFFVLVDIYNIIFKNAYSWLCSFTGLALQYIICNLPTGFPGPIAFTSLREVNTEITDQPRIQHLVDLRIMCCGLLMEDQQLSKGNRCVPEDIKKKIINVIKCRVDLQRIMGHCLPIYQRDEIGPKQKPEFRNFGSAMHLSAAGVIFEASESHNLMDIEFDKNKGVLKIPKLALEDDTESALRNLLFFEQCHYVYQKKFLISNYTIFLDTLIDTVDDVQVLQKKKIIDNQLGSDQDVLDLFNNLNKNIVYDLSYSKFFEVSEDLKAYTSSKMNKWKAILWRKYFNHPWAIISVIYAVILLILTLLQTITGFLQVT